MNWALLFLVSDSLFLYFRNPLKTSAMVVTLTLAVLRKKSSPYIHVKSLHGNINKAFFFFLFCFPPPPPPAKETE